jgi:hypothetical protein
MVIALAIVGLIAVFSSVFSPVMDLMRRRWDRERRRRQRQQQELNCDHVPLHVLYLFVAVFAVVNVALIAIEPVVVGGLLLMTLVGHLITVRPRQRPRDGRRGRGADLPGAQAVTATAGRSRGTQGAHGAGWRSIRRRGARPSAGRAPAGRSHESVTRSRRAVRR